jgi:UDP-N-acetyl-2-amino-2-deoxyglucuronate dehydrogenase
MLIFLFGQPTASTLSQYSNDTGSGVLEFSNARVEWFLSTNHIHLPQGHQSSTYRSMMIDGEEFEFSAGFTDLHAESYRSILEGRGFGISDVRPSVELVFGLRKTGLALSC